MKNLKIFIQILIVTILLIPFTTKAEDINFRLADYYVDFQVDSHYIIAAYNSDNHNWYAIGVTDDGQATPVKISNPKNGLKINKSDLKTSNYIFTGSKKPADYSLKFRSNITNEESSKKYSLYLNKSLFNLGGGDIRLNKYEYNNKHLFRLSYRNYKYLIYNTSTNSFDYGSSTNGYKYDLNGNIVDTNTTTTYFYILTDFDRLSNESESKVLYKYNTIGSMSDLMYFLSDSDKIQFVYTSGNNKYMLTSDGGKKVSISGNSFTTKDYISLYHSRNYSSNPFADSYSSGSDQYLVENLMDVNFGWSAYLYMNDSGLSFYHNYKFLNLSNYNDELFVDDDYYYYYSDLNVFYKTPYTTDLFTDRLVNPVTYDDYYDVAFNEPAKVKLCNYEDNNSDFRCVGWDSSNNKFVKVNNMDDAILFDVYSSKKQIDKVSVVFHNVDGTESYTKTTYTDQDLYKIDNKIYKYMNSDGTVTYTNKNRRFLGFTTDPNNVGIVKNEYNENILDYNTKTKRVEITPEFKEKYSMITKLSEAKPVNGVINLYPVLFNDTINRTEYTSVDDKGEPLISVVDWKDGQTEYNQDNSDKYDINNGSINIEIYRDGKLWVPKDKVHYTYHNDNSADLIIKFIDNTISGGQQQAYIHNNTKFTPSTNNLYIVGIYAEQGASEEGLYEPFNWMSENGGLLDNVKGGSTVKIYLSSKYTSKYYLNDKLYKTDELIYTPTATKEAIEYNSKHSKYVVNSKNNNTLLNKTDNVSFFKNDDLGRGEYSSFSYEILNERDTMDVLDLPNKKLVYDFWVVKDENNNVVGKALEKEYIKIKSKDAVNFLYVGNDDMIDTVHLYAYTPGYDKIPSVPKNTPIISSKRGFFSGFTNPNTGESILFVILVMSICLGIGIYSNKKVKEFS